MSILIPPLSEVPDDYFPVVSESSESPPPASAPPPTTTPTSVVPSSHGDVDDTVGNVLPPSTSETATSASPLLQEMDTVAASPSVSHHDLNAHVIPHSAPPEEHDDHTSLHVGVGTLTHQVQSLESVVASLKRHLDAHTEDLEEAMVKSRTSFMMSDDATSLVGDVGEAALPSQPSKLDPASSPSISPVRSSSVSHDGHDGSALSEWNVFFDVIWKSLLVHVHDSVWIVAAAEYFQRVSLVDLLSSVTKDLSDADGDDNASSSLPVRMIAATSRQLALWWTSHVHNSSTQWSVLTIDVVLQSLIKYWIDVALMVVIIGSVVCTIGLRLRFSKYEAALHALRRRT